MTSNGPVRTSVRINRQLDRLAHAAPVETYGERLARRGITNQYAAYPAGMSSDGVVTS